MLADCQGSGEDAGDAVVVAAAGDYAGEVADDDEDQGRSPGDVAGETVAVADGSWGGGEGTGMDMLS